MSDSRPLTRRAKTVLLGLFMILSLIWPLIVPADKLIPYAYLIGGVTAAGLGFQAGVDWQRAKGGSQ